MGERLNTKSLSKNRGCSVSLGLLWGLSMLPQDQQQVSPRAPGPFLSPLSCDCCFLIRGGRSMDAGRCGLAVPHASLPAAAVDTAAGNACCGPCCEAIISLVVDAAYAATAAVAAERAAALASISRGQHPPLPPPPQIVGAWPF